VYFCHIVTAADGYPCAVVISTAVIFLIGIDETRLVHFVLCFFIHVLHFVSARHKKKKAMVMLCQQRDGRSFSGKTVFKNHALACAFRHEVFGLVPECRNEGSDVEVRGVCL
jgi:hypothetical protein